MALSWNEIKERAIAFSKEWENTSNEEADAKPFLDAFFNVFDISRRKMATFEHRVKKLNETDGYIDLLWKGTILIEMKSKGKNLDKAYTQAKEYTHGLKQNDLPKFILVCDFETFKLYDLDSPPLEGLGVVCKEFKLKDFAKNVEHFAYLIGRTKQVYKEQDPANIKAAELMGKLHDRLEEIGYTEHPLEVYLVRILFCLFAEDTDIFSRQQFQDYVEQRTNIDGSDLAAKIQELFQVLNTPTEKRFKNLDEDLANFAYVNGRLFEEVLPTASFDSKMRQALLDCCYIDWSKISPAIFGSMFQSVMNPKERRNLGAHYTSEINILKLIKPLFLDELWKEFEKVKDNKAKLQEFHLKISKLKFLDPACGCGNFLVITYRELRLLELEIIKVLLFKFMKLRSDVALDAGIKITELTKLNISQFYGIEYEEFPARIAEVAMLLIDHQMNILVTNTFGKNISNIPIKSSSTIINANALQIDWATLKNPNAVTIYADQLNFKQMEAHEPRAEYLTTVNVVAQKANKINANQEFPTPKPTNKIHYDYILGNPPFIGKKEMKANQKADTELVLKGIKGTGVLDYVACWYIKAAELIQGTQIKVAFVSTNSISQGEQVGVLWNILFNHYNIKIHFAHRTFQWTNEAKGKAAVHCVIIGFANFNTDNKRLFEYDDIKAEPHEIKVSNINPFLLEAKDITVENRKQPICNVQEINYGSFALDDGYYTLTEDEKNDFIKDDETLLKFIRPFIGGKELLRSEKRYCLWLADATPKEINSSTKIIKRVNEVRKWRENSDRINTKKLAETPAVFAEIRQPKTQYLAFPTVSSGDRKYIPLAFLNPEIIASNQLYVIPNASLFSFGILTSSMHMSWVKYVGGRLKSDFRYSSGIIYNNFPWAENPTSKQKEAIEKAAQIVLDVREMYPDSSLSDLYGKTSLKPNLSKAHNELDKAVDAAYRKEPFTSDAKRMEFLFELYEKYTANLFTKEKVKKGKKK